MVPFDEGERTLIRPDFEPSEDLEREEVERIEEASVHSEVEPREELLFRGMSKSETKSHKWRRELSHSANTHSSLAKQSNNAMMSSISPSEEQTGSKAKKSWKSLYDERMASPRTEGLSSSYDHPEITHPDVNFTPCPRNDMSRKASSASPTRPMSDGITMGASSTFDRLMMSMGKQKGGASSSTRLQPQLTSSSLGLTAPLGASGDISDMFAGIMIGLDELRRDMTKRIDQVDERAHQGYDKLPLTRWLDKSGHPIPGHPELPVETAAEIKVLARGEPVPLDLLVRYNLVQQELTRLGINSIALLNRTVNVAPDVMGKLRDLLDREVDRHDRE